MRAATFMFVCSIFCVIFLSVITQAQNSLTHNTGSLQLTAIDNGYIGDDGSGTYGGIVFNGNINAMYSAGTIFGQASIGGAYGMIGSFGVEDFVNTVPISGFFDDPFFDQISEYSAELIINPDSDGFASTKSTTGQDFVFFLQILINNNPTSISDIYLGIFADWDIGGGAGFLRSRGGYDPDRNMLYQYENLGFNDPNYYGIVLINKPPNTVRGTVFTNETSTSLEEYRLEVLSLMTSTDFTPITTEGDYRTYLSDGPFNIPAGQTLVGLPVGVRAPVRALPGPDAVRSGAWTDCCGSLPDQFRAALRLR